MKDKTIIGIGYVLFNELWPEKVGEVLNRVGSIPGVGTIYESLHANRVYRFAAEVPSKGIADTALEMRKTGCIASLEIRLPSKVVLKQE